MFMVQSSEIFTKEFSALQNQLFTDILELKEGLERLKITVEVFNKWHSHQLNDLTNIISSGSENHIIQYNDDNCEEILYFTNETIAKYDQFNNKLKLQMEETQRNQSQNLEELLKNIVLQNECQDLESKSTARDSLLTDIEDKVNKVEEKLTQFEILEKKISLQQNKYETLNGEQMELLQKIKDKLNQNEAKFIKYEKEVPDMNNFSNKINNMANWRHWRHRNSPRQ